MKVTIHTPKVLVELYDLPELGALASDAEVLAAAGPVSPIESALRAEGSPYVAARELDDVEAAGRRLIEARDAYQRAQEQARAMVEPAAAAGMSEHALAEKFGVDRMTIRRWRGKL